MDLTVIKVKTEVELHSEHVKVFTSGSRTRYDLRHAHIPYVWSFKQEELRKRPSSVDESQSQRGRDITPPNRSTKNPNETQGPDSGDVKDLVEVK